MILKWIICSVPVDSKDDFSAAQKQWSVIRSQPGFVAQCGGFHPAKTSLTACILSIWKNEQAYQSFMREVHDTVFLSNDQGRFIKEIHISLFTLEMKKSVDQEKLLNALRACEVLRVADCLVLPGRVDNFSEAQESIWNPGMLKSDGCLNGAFWQNADDPNQFIVTSFWRDFESHQKYRQNIFPELYKQAKPDSDCRKITGYVVSINPEWTVVSSESDPG